MFFHSHYYLILLFAVFLYSCNNAGNQQRATIENKGVSIAYTDSREGDTSLLFIHGWGIDHTYWDRQAEYFSDKYRVITIDLPGFGRSGRNRDDWSVENFGKDISAVINELDLKHVIVIGHSMSGSIAVEAALMEPGRIIGVAGVDNLKDIGVIITPQLAREWAAFYNAARSDFRKTVSGSAARYLFAPNTSSAVRERVMNDILSADPGLAVDCLDNTDKYPFVEKLRSLKKTVYLINSDYIPTDTAAFRKNGIDFRLFNISGTGHYPMIESPQEFNALLKQVIENISA